MPRDGAIIFSGLFGGLDIVRVTCDKCDRAGSYRLNRSRAVAMMRRSSIGYMK